MSGEEKNSDDGMRRRWVAWGTVGVVAVVAVGAAVIAVPLLRTPAAAPTPTPSATSSASEPSPTPSAAPTPSCTVTAREVVWSDPNVLDLPRDGRLTATPIQRIEGVREQPGIWPDGAAFAIDDALVGVLTNVNGLDGTSHLSVIGRDGAVRWEGRMDGYASVLSAPATTGVPGRLVMEAHNGDGDFRMISFDLATGEVLRERESGEVYAVTRYAARASDAHIAPDSADAFFVSNRDALSRIDPVTLETEWSVTGEKYGVEWFEGGVPFDVITDVVFVGPHAVDARSGEALGWESPGRVFEVAGATLQTPFLYDYVGPYDVSGLDTTTGDACWTREILDLAATSDTLWLLRDGGVIERVDPFTGETIETISAPGATGVMATGDRLIAVEEDRDDYTAPLRYTFYEGATALGTVEADGRGGFLSGDQFLVYNYGSVKVPETLTAYDLASPTPAWQIDGEGLAIDAGIVLRTTWDARTERVEVELLR